MSRPGIKNDIIEFLFTSALYLYNCETDPLDFKVKKPYRAYFETPCTLNLTYKHEQNTYIHIYIHIFNYIYTNIYT